MKFFWKIFFTTMFISTACVAVSGCILIHSNFRSQLKSEAQVARDYGDIVYYSLASELREWELESFFIPQEAGSPKETESSGETRSKNPQGREENPGEQDRGNQTESLEKAVLQIAKNIGINQMNQNITFAIINKQGNTLFSSLSQDLDKSMVKKLSSSQASQPSDAGWELKKKGQSAFIQTIRPARYQNCTLYIETVRDATHILKSQKKQSEMLIKLMAGMVVLAGALTLILSKVLLRPVEELRKTTKVISEGNLSQRAVCRGSDEISLLSEHFNQMADHLEEKISQLEEETEKKELFVGAFSHELKTPLTSIIGYADLIRSRKLDQEQRKICAEYIFSEGQRLEHLSMRLLELIVLKKHSLSPEPVSVRALMERVTETMGPQLAAADITLFQNIEDAVIPMEEELMKTVFFNLLDNARKAMESGGCIEICGTSGGSGETSKTREYCLTIRDQGKGMEQGELEKIREAFYMVDKSRSRNQGGAGLGLAICDGILKLHDFAISFESAPGKGTAVTITMKEERP